MFTESYLPYINGVVTHVKSLKDGLEKAGHQVLIVTVDVNARHHHLEGDVLYCPGKELKRLYDYGLANPFSRTRFRIIQEFHPDIIHIHTEFGVGLSAVRIARKLQIPYVYTLHTMYEDYLYYVAPKPFIPMVRIMSRRYFKYFAQHSQAVTGPSAKVQEYLDECHADRKVNVVPNPVELDKFSPDKVNWDHVAQLKQQYGFREGEMIAGFCGRLGREKSVDVLLDYFSQQVKREDGIKLMIIGTVPPVRNWRSWRKSWELPIWLPLWGRWTTMRFWIITPVWMCMSPPASATPTPSPCWREWPPVCRCCTSMTPSMPVRCSLG